MALIVTLSDRSPANGRYRWEFQYTYGKFRELFDVIDISEYRASESDADVTILDRFAMSAYLDANPPFRARFRRFLGALGIRRSRIWPDRSYEKSLDRFRGARNLVFLTSDLHYWSIFPDQVLPPEAFEGDITPSSNRYDRLFEMFDSLGIRNLITYYECPELRQIVRLRPALQTFVIDYHFDPSIFRDYGLRKDYDVIIYGALTPAVYPFRNRVCRLLIDSGRFRVLHIEMPNGSCDSTAISGEGLARKINSSWLGLSTTSNFDYLVGKYFEVPACRAVVLGNMNEQGRAIFEDRYIHIDSDMSDHQIVSRVEEALSDKQELDRLAGEMHEVMHRNYTLKENERKLLKAVDMIRAGFRSIDGGPLLIR